MLTLPPGVQVFVATERTDGRKGIDGRAAIYLDAELRHGRQRRALIRAVWRAWAKRAVC